MSEGNYKYAIILRGNKNVGKKSTLNIVLKKIRQEKMNLGNKIKTISICIKKNETKGKKSFEYHFLYLFV